METNLVRELRVKAGIPGTAMAAKLGMPIPTYYKKETGEIPWKLPEAKSVSDFFGRSIEDIFYANKISSGDS